MQNPHETAARSVKVQKLVEAIDSMDFGCPKNTERFHAALVDQKPEWWVTLAAFAGVHVPSATTIALVLAIYRERPALHAAVARLEGRAS